MRILTIIEHYLPGYKAGGPIRTLANLIESLGQDFEFFILTLDRDFKDREPYTAVLGDVWSQRGRARVFYARRLSFSQLRERIAEVGPAVLYLNGFFSRSTIRVLLLRQLRLIPRCPIVLAVRGQFSEGALGLKRARKRLFMSFLFRPLYDGVLWHGSTEHEGGQIREILARYGIKGNPQVTLARNIYIAADIPTVSRAGTRSFSDAKEAGRARFVFLGRVSPMKNLKYGIAAFSQLRGEAEFHVYGPLEDPAYWAVCQQVITELPAGVKVEYRGVLAPDQIDATLANYHFLVLPTLGENFGHVIIEALSAGCPALISDRTPWSRLADEGVGWTLSLEDFAGWRMVVQNCVDMDGATFLAISRRAKDFAEKASASSDARAENADLFRSAMLTGGATPRGGAR